MHCLTKTVCVLLKHGHSVNREILQTFLLQFFLISSYISLPSFPISINYETNGIYTLVQLNLNLSSFENIVDLDQLSSSEAI